MKHCVTALVLAIALLYFSGSVAQTTRPLDSGQIIFYLPIHSQQFPGLIDTLQALLQESNLPQVNVQPADYWESYQQGLRLGKRGIYFAAPHYVAWAARNHSFLPLLTLSEPLQYVIAAKRSDSSVFEINDLNKKTVCTKRALNLDYLLVNSAFDNKLLAAHRRPVWSVIDEMTNESGSDVNRCVAYVVSAHHFKLLQLERPDKFIRLQQGPVFSNYAFVVDPSMSLDTRIKLKRFLLSADAQTTLHQLYLQTATNPELVNAIPSDYPSDQAKPLLPYWGLEPQAPVSIQ